jgi:hypothetical protein
MTAVEKNSAKLFFFLISFNGSCYQTYGVLAYFKGIQAFDIFYFAKQLRPEIVFVNEIPGVIEKDPVPFCMLFDGSELPVTVHKTDMLVLNQSEFRVAEFHPEVLADSFYLETKQHVTMMSLKGWAEFPHFAKCFFHSKHKCFIVTAMTDRGYALIVDAMNKAEQSFPVQPEHRATVAMIELTHKILGKRFAFSPYEKMFRKKKPSPEEKVEIDKMNKFLKLLMNAHNLKNPIISKPSPLKRVWTWKMPGKLKVPF